MKTNQFILVAAATALLVPFTMAQEVVRETVPAPTGVPADEVAAVGVRPVEAVGTVAELGDGAIAIRAKAELAPVQYRFSKTTQWVDEAGNVVTRESIRQGLPVTVYYTKAPQGLVVSKVVVRRQTTVQPVPEQVAPTAVAPDSTVIERRAPKVIERREPVIVERPVPKVIERREPVVVEEKPAPPLVEKKKTTTITTTTPTKKKNDDDDDDD